MRILVTGGAGFIGRHLVEKLLEEGHVVGIMDCLIPQVHPQSPDMPKKIWEIQDRWNADDEDPRFYTYFTDVRDPRISGVPFVIGDFKPEVVFHLAAEVGVGQGQAQPASYVATNVMGTAVLLDELAKYNKEGDLKQVILAGSMSAYGDTGGPANENDDLAPPNVYAWTKQAQEDLLLQVFLTGRLNASCSVARFFNVYGPGQALSNPYTGVAAIFASAFLNHESPVIFGSGNELRDFIHVSDVVSGLISIMDHKRKERFQGYEVFNVGTGVPTKIIDLAHSMKRLFLEAGFKSEGEVRLSGMIRNGDIKVCYADNTRLRMTGWEPLVSIEDGLREYIGFLLNERNIGNIGANMAPLQTDLLYREGLLFADNGPGGQIVS